MNCYKLLSEIVMGNPSTDMLIIRPSLFVYVSEDMEDEIKENGIKIDPNSGLSMLMGKLPDDKYSEYLNGKLLIKIQLNKLEKIKNKILKMTPLNFDYDKENLSIEDIEEINKKSIDKILKKYSIGLEVNKLPSIQLYMKDNRLPSFICKVITEE